MTLWERLRNYWSGTPEGGPAHAPRELIPKKAFDMTVRDQLGSALEQEGFRSATKNRWVRENAADILGMVELQQLNAAVSAVWGVSLAFVPHVNPKDGYRIEWHRTEKTVRFDLSYNPLDYEKDLAAWSVDQWTWRETFAADASEFAARVAQSAATFLQPLRNVQEVLSAQEQKRERASIRLSFEHYPQEVLAYAFVLARCGRLRDAELAVDLFGESMRQFDDCRDMPSDPIDQLKELLHRT